MPHDRLTRREFGVRVAALTLLLVARPREAWSSSGARDPWPHPAPRPGITGAHVLKAERLDNKNAAPVFDMVRQIPEIVDGIRCHCGCAELPGYRSLLSCYEAPGMAQECEVCQGQGTLAFTLHRQGKTLDQIRAAIDARFG